MVPSIFTTPPRRRCLLIASCAGVSLVLAICIGLNTLLISDVLFSPESLHCWLKAIALLLVMRVRSLVGSIIQPLILCMSRHYAAIPLSLSLNAPLLSRQQLRMHPIWIPSGCGCRCRNGYDSCAAAEWVKCHACCVLRDACCVLRRINHSQTVL